jgi:hypothetical protein
VGIPEQDAALRNLVEIWRLHHVADTGGARGASRFRVNTGMPPPVVREQEQDIRGSGTQRQRAYATQKDDQQSVHKYQRRLGGKPQVESRVD